MCAFKIFISQVCKSKGATVIATYNTASGSGNINQELLDHARPVAIDSEADLEDKFTMLDDATIIVNNPM